MTDIKLPNLGEGITQGEIVKVSVSAGQTITKGETLVEVETDKAVAEVPAEVSGVISVVLIKVGDKVSPGQVLFKIDSADVSAVPPLSPQGRGENSLAPEGRDLSEAKREGPSDIPASPSIRRLARERDIDLNSITGSGPAGLILESDLQTPCTTASHTMAAPIALPDFSKFGEIEVLPFSSVRKKTAEAMTLSWSRIPQVTQFDQADISNLEHLKKQFGKRAEAAGGKLTLTVILVKVIASALKVFPQVNTSLDEDAGRLIRKKFVNIGVAVDTEHGLLVPVIHHADKKNILDLSILLTQLADKARARKLTKEEMAGGSFTITNLGGIGGSHFTPIVNWPQAAILGVGRAKMEPTWIDGTFVPRQMLPLSLTYDHRLIDGADAARFLRWIAGAIEEPFLMELEG